MVLRAAQFGFCLIVLFAVLDSLNTAIAFGGCGPGCHTSPSGACVRDGWEQGLPVRNECPAFTSPRPPCGPYLRWDRRMKACFPADASYPGYAIGGY
jgi:hypothetical protein